MQIMQCIVRWRQSRAQCHSYVCKRPLEMKPVEWGKQIFRGVHFFACVEEEGGAQNLK
jgi:hypothetical protein